LFSVASLLGLVTTLNQFIIDTAPQHPRQDTPRKPQQSCLALAASLSAVKQLEVLIEVVAEHYKGREKKWNTLAAMEAIK
jgi:peroxin-16